MSENQEDAIKNTNRHFQFINALTHLQKGLSPFVEHCLDCDYQKIKEEVICGSKLNFSCGNCHLETLKPNHNKELCKPEDGSKKSKRRYKCPLGQDNCNCLKDKHMLCKVCGVVYSEIIKRHSTSSPNWKNTNISEWCTDPIEIMKCFIKAPGYCEKKLVSKVDICGLLQYVIHNKTAHSILNINVNGSDVYSETLKRRNEISHLENPEKFDCDITPYINDCIHILDNVSQSNLKTWKQTTEARDALKQIIDTDYMVLTDGQLMTLQKKQLSDSQETKTHILAMREDLITFLRAEYSSMQISPTRPEVDAALLDLYVAPKVCQVKVESFIDKQSAYRKEVKEVKCYTDILSNSKNIYLIGEPGTGKTSFIRLLALAWCEAHSLETHCKYNFAKEDLSEMKKIDAVFIINLDDISSEISDIDKMITDQIIPYLSRSSRYKSGQILENILHYGKCLIILDSLEKWSGKNFSIPYRKARENYVITTVTSSCWESIKLASSKCDQLIEIKKMDDDAISKLISNLLQIRFPENQKSHDEVQEICAEIKKKYWSENTQIPEGALYVPFKVMDVFCQWADDENYTS